ncbi:unnamed protein product [Durusdinium trenchii]
MKISDRGTELLDRGSPRVLVWLLDALSDADLHPDERKQLTFPRAYRDTLNVKSSSEALSEFSNDELCIAWRAFDRLQLLDRPTLKQFLHATTKPLLTQRCHGPMYGEVRPRYSSFTLWNWVIQAEGLRNLKHQPLQASPVIAKSMAKRLLVEEEHQLRAEGLTFSALQALVNMVPLSSRQRHRMVAQLSFLLPALSSAELAALPRLASRGQLQDEDFFQQVAQRLSEVFRRLTTRELLTAFRGLLVWRVGVPGLDRSAAVAFGDHVMWNEQTPSTALRLLRALGRIDSSTLNVGSRESTTEEQVMLVKAFRGSLKVLTSPAAKQSLNSRDLLVAMNALGQISRAWDWLGSGIGEAEAEKEVLEELHNCTLVLSEVVGLELMLDDAHDLAGKTSWDSYSARDLALMLLAQVRVARRLRSPSDGLPQMTQILCHRLKRAAVHRAQLGRLDQQKLKDVAAEAKAALSASSLMLSYCAKDVDMQRIQCQEYAYTEPLEVIVSWSEAASKLGLGAFEDSYKALAATTMLISTSPSSTTPEMKGLLGWLLKFATGIQDFHEKPIGQDPEQEDHSHLTTQMANWHLDSCLHAIAVLETLDFKPDWLIHLQDAVLREVSNRIPKLKKNSIVFWLRLLDPHLAPHRLAKKLTLELRCGGSE